MNADPHPSDLPVAELRGSVEAAGLPWREPRQSFDDEDGWMATWFGAGTQGNEPARLLMIRDEDGVAITLVTSRDDCSRLWERADHVASYREFCRLNGWWSG